MQWFNVVELTMVTMANLQMGEGFLHNSNWMECNRFKKKKKKTFKSLSKSRYSSNHLKNINKLKCVRSITLILTLFSTPAKLPQYQHTGSSLTVCQNWPRSLSNRRRRCCNLSWIRDRCRSCTSGPSPLRCHGKRAGCSGCWVHSGQTCTRPGCPGSFGCGTPRQRPVPAGSTASLPARSSEGWTSRWPRLSAPSKWAQGAEKRAWTRSGPGRAGNRKASTAHLVRNHSSWGLALAWRHGVTKLTSFPTAAKQFNYNDKRKHKKATE